MKHTRAVDDRDEANNALLFVSDKLWQSSPPSRRAVTTAAAESVPRSGQGVLVEKAAPPS